MYCTGHLPAVLQCYSVTAVLLLTVVYLLDMTLEKQCYSVTAVLLLTVVYLLYLILEQQHDSPWAFIHPCPAPGPWLMQVFAYYNHTALYYTGRHPTTMHQPRMQYTAIVNHCSVGYSFTVHHCVIHCKNTPVQSSATLHHSAILYKTASQCNAVQPCTALQCCATLHYNVMWCNTAPQCNTVQHCTIV